jgi:hypothetical protein
MARVKKTYGLSTINTQPRQILEGIIELSFLNRIKEKADELAPVIQKKIGKFNAIQERVMTGKSAFPRVSKARAKEMYREVAGGKLPDNFDITAVKGGSHFNPGTSAGGSAMRSSPTAEIIAHEAGHARQARIAKVLAYRAAKKAGVPAHEAIAIAKNAPAAVFAGTNYAKQIPTKTKAGAVIASLPNLAIEADASRRAVKHLGKDAIPALARAWSTYAAGAASKIRKAGRVEMSAREELISIIEFGWRDKAAKAIPGPVRRFFTGEGATMPPAVEEAIRKTAAHPAAKMAGIDGEAIIEQGRKIAREKTGEINRKIVAWSVIPPAIQYGISKRDSNNSEKKIMKAIKERPVAMSARESLNAICFADPRPRNPLGMFTGADGSGIDPEAIGTVYKQGAQVAQQEESALAGIARKLKGKKIRMSARESLDEIRFARGERAIRQIWPVTEHEKMAMFNKVPVFAKSRKMLADRLRAELPELRKAMAYQKDELRATGYTGKFHWGARESLDSIINFAKGDFLMRTMKKVGVSTPRAELDAIEAAGRGVQGAFNQAATGAGRADLAGADTIGKVRSHLAGQLNEARKATRNAPFKKPVAERPIAPNSGTAPDPRLKTAASYGNTPVGQTGSSVQPVNPAPYQQPVAKQPVAQEAVAQQAAQKQAEEMAGGAVKQPTAMSGPNLKYRLRGWRGASLAGAAGLGAGYALGGGSSNV